MQGCIELTRQAGVARVSLSNRSRFNAMSRAMWRELRAVFGQIQCDAGIACVVVQGDGNFCAGGDISEYADFRFTEASLHDFHENDVWGGLQAMLDCDVPVLAQIQGNCMGAGVEIASCCDIRVASDDARFGAPIARLGFPMAPREAALVTHALGELTAREMLLSAAVLDATEMQRRGFLNRVVAASQLDAAVDEYAQRISQLAPQATRLNKQMLRALAAQGTDATALVASAYRYADSAEHRHGVMAFIEKRTPRFER